MSENNVKIFVVDDDDLSRMILTDELNESNYEIVEFSNGQECIEALSQEPDVILMDVEMPKMDGYETCRQVKRNPTTADTEVIFISSHDTTEEKLAGYDAGGSDYIIKPVQPLEVKQKISVAIKNRAERKEKASEVQSAMKTAMTAISSAGEQGVVLDFMRRSFTVETAEKLAELIIESFRNFDLSTTVQLRTERGVINHSSTQPPSPLEAELLTRLKDSGRIECRGKRLIANFGPISMLIKNMPDDTDKAGRIRDHLALLLEGAQARLSSLETLFSIAKVISQAKQSLGDIEMMQQAQKSTAMEIIDGTLEDLEQTFMTCGLTEEQEVILLKIVQEGVSKSLDNFEKGVEIDKELRSIIAALESCQPNSK